MQCPTSTTEVSRFDVSILLIAITSMPSVTDRDTQYFLAEASRPAPGLSNKDTFQKDEDLLFVGGFGVPKKGKMCEVRCFEGGSQILG